MKLSDNIENALNRLENDEAWDVPAFRKAIAEELESAKLAVVERIENNCLKTAKVFNQPENMEEVEVNALSCVRILFETLQKIKAEIVRGSISEIKMQSQAELSHQLDKLEQLAVNNGLYDAHDFLRGCRKNKRQTEKQAVLDVVKTIELASLQKFDPISGEKLSYFVPAHVINNIKAGIEVEK